MKGIAIIAGLSLAVNAQLNFDINGGGFRFGVMGSEVININSPNAGQKFPDSYPLGQNVGVNFQNLNPFKKPAGPQVQLKFVPQRVQPIMPPLNAPIVTLPEAPKPIEENNQEKKEIKAVEPKVQIMDNKEKQTAKHESVIKKDEEKPKQQEIKQNRPVKPASEIKADFIKSTETQTLVLNVQKTTKQNEPTEDEMARKQAQRLIRVIKMMPQAQKQHLRAIATQKTQN